MSRQLKGLLYFQAVNGKHSLTIFWSILLGTTVVSVVIAALTMGTGDVKMVMTFSAPIYIYAMFIGFNSAKTHVRYALRLGATRKNIFIRSGIYFLAISLVSAFLVSVFQQLITFITSRFDIDSFRLMHPASILRDTWMNRIVIDTTLMFFFLALLFFFGLLFYRYGLTGGGSFGAALIILMLVALGTGWLQDVLVSFVETVSITYFFDILLAGIGIYLINWAFLRRITILMKS